jgi:hypothetical protein
MGIFQCQLTSVNGRNKGEDGGPHEVEGIRKANIVGRREAAYILKDIVAVTLDNAIWRGE